MNSTRSKLVLPGCLAVLAIALIASFFLWRAYFASTKMPLVDAQTLEALDFPDGRVLHGDERLSTKSFFKPPVEITIVAKTDSTNIRMAYAADQIIFNWEVNPNQLRVDGGPADGQHKARAGQIPINQYVTIKWVVTSSAQTVYVDGEERFHSDGDYSGINREATVFPANGSTITVRSLRVRRLATLSP